MSKLRKIFGVFFAVLAVVVNYSSPVTTYSKLPDKIVIQKGEEVDINFGLPVKYSVQNSGDLSISPDNDFIMGTALGASIVSNDENSSDVEISAFGIFPSRKLNIVTIDESKVYLGGQNIGIILKCDGVLVVGYSEVIKDDASSVIPAKDAGILVGDFITHVDGKEVDSAAHLGNIIRVCDGKEVEITLRRGSSTKNVIVNPASDRSDEQYHIGIWGRDSSSGIGTVTFIDPNTYEFGALGHSISDIDAGVILDIREGEIYNSRVAEIYKGVPGMPGEIRGEFILDIDKVGAINDNTKFGLFGQIDNQSFAKNAQLVDVAQVHEVVEGNAKIYTSIDNEGVKAYDCKISKIDYSSTNSNKNFLVTVTDEKLLEVTGGIVQGMSGSPIVQNDKIVGAVTHVFVNNPSMGHGVFISSMVNYDE